MDNFPRPDAPAAVPIGDVDGRSGTGDANVSGMRRRTLAASSCCCCCELRHPDMMLGRNGRKVNGETALLQRAPMGERRAGCVAESTDAGLHTDTLLPVSLEHEVPPGHAHPAAKTSCPEGVSGARQPLIRRMARFGPWTVSDVALARSIR